MEPMHPHRLPWSGVIAPADGVRRQGSVFAPNRSGDCLLFLIFEGVIFSISPFSDDQIALIRRKRRGIDPNAEYRRLPLRRNHPAFDFLGMYGTRVSWSIRDPSDFGAILEAARLCRGRFEKKTRSWDLGEKVGAFCWLPEVRRIGAKVTLLVGEDMARFRMWQSVDGAFALAQPLSAGCAIASLKKLWWRVENGRIAPPAKGILVADARELDALPAAPFFPWNLRWQTSLGECFRP